jgi:hypothetical protein
MTIHAPSMHAPAHMPHIVGSVFAPALVVLLIAFALLIRPVAAPTRESTTTWTSDQAAAAYQAYRAGERADYLTLFADQFPPLQVTSAYQLYRQGERAPLSP